MISPFRFRPHLGSFGFIGQLTPRQTRPSLTLSLSPTLSSSFSSSTPCRKAASTPLCTARTRSQSEAPSTAPAEAESSVARGTRYELLCRSVLSSIFGMALERTGGAGDRGIDLRGWWSPPQSSNRIRILAQCKCQDEGGKKMGPVLIREMEGVIFRASSPSSDTEEASAPTAGIILSSSGFSKQALLQMRSSGVALAAMHVLALPQVEVENREEGDLVERCVSIVWNIKFGGAYGLLEGGMEARWVRSIGAGGGSAMGRPVIYRGGRPI